jgi:hypothetical protein
MLHTHHLHAAFTRTNAQSLGTFQTTMLFRNRGAINRKVLSLLSLKGKWPSTNWTIEGRCPSGAIETFFFLPSMYPFYYISPDILKGATQVVKTTAGWQHSLLSWTLYTREVPGPNFSPNTGYPAGASCGFPSLYKENQTSTCIVSCAGFTIRHCSVKLARWWKRNKLR